MIVLIHRNELLKHRQYRGSIPIQGTVQSLPPDPDAA